MLGLDRCAFSCWRGTLWVPRADGHPHGAKGEVSRVMIDTFCQTKGSPLGFPFSFQVRFLRQHFLSYDGLGAPPWSAAANDEKV